VQFSITNNGVCDIGKDWSDCEQQDLSYNIKFTMVPQNINSSYGVPLAEAKWYPTDPTLAPQEDVKGHFYKHSATEYSDVCLTFNPPLPSMVGWVEGGNFVDKLCVPFAESTVPTGAIGGAPAPEAGGPPAQTPGGLV